MSRDTPAPRSASAPSMPSTSTGPHPGAQLDAIEERGGYRYTAPATDTRIDQHARLHAHHRGRPRRGPHSPAATPDGWRPTKPVPT
jgi:hypothetical protein